MKNIVKDNIGQSAESVIGLKLDFWNIFLYLLFLIHFYQNPFKSYFSLNLIKLFDKEYYDKKRIFI